MSAHDTASQTDPLPAQSWKYLYTSVLAFLGSRKGPFIFWSILLIASQAYALVPPLLIGHIVDFFLVYQPGQSLQPFYNDVIVLGLSSAIAAYVRLLSKDRLGKIDIETVYQAKVSGFDRLMRYNLSWHQRENTGNKMQRLQHGLNQLRQLLRISHDDLPALAISFGGVLIIFVMKDWLFAVFLAVYVAVFAAIEIYFYRKLQESNHNFNQATEMSSGTYLESANNVLTIKTMGATQELKQNLDKVETKAKDLAYDNHHLITKKWQYFQVVNAVALAVFLLIVGHSVIAGVMTAGAAFVYFTYYQRLADSATNGVSTLLSLLEFKSAIERMMPIYDQAPQQVFGQTFPLNWRDIEIDRGSLTFKFDQQEFKITDLSLRLDRGQKIGVVGRSGSGKSTLAKLLLGIHQLESGSLTIGGVPLQSIDAAELTRHITIVPQETELFNTSLLENITMMKKVDQVKLDKAIRVACLQPVIDKLPGGLDTNVGAKGGRLSGGEKQRIGIARAVYADTEIMVFDEATSALDSKTEIMVQDALEKELKGKTLIIIAHRFMTLNQVDRIIVFDKGRVIEQDGFAKLLGNTSSAFYELYKIQQPKKLVLPSNRHVDIHNSVQIYPTK